MIDLRIHPEGRAHNLACARENGIVIPTFAQMKDPSLIPQKVLDKLAVTGLWDIDPVNLFRVSWHNEPKEHGGLFGAPNYIRACPAASWVSSASGSPPAATRSAPPSAASCRSS